MKQRKGKTKYKVYKEAVYAKSKVVYVTNAMIGWWLFVVDRSSREFSKHPSVEEI